MWDAMGLDPVLQRVYETLVDGPSSASELRERLGLSAARTSTRLTELERLGLVGRFTDHNGQARFRAAPPDVALGALLGRREEQLRHAREHVERLAARYRLGAGGPDRLDVVEVITGRAAVIQRVDQLQRAAQRQIRGIDRPPYVNNGPDRLDPKTGMMPLQEPTMRRGVRYRVLYDSEALASHQHRFHLDVAASAELGEEARVMSQAPTKMVLADDRVALLPLLTAPDELTGAVVVHASGLLRALVALFETLWSTALPLSEYLDRGPSVVGAPAPGTPTTEEARLLALLTTGVTDQVMARQLGVSYRTFQRRLQSLMHRHGATTRFQLGLRAARMGWLDQATREGTDGGPPGNGS